MGQTPPSTVPTPHNLNENEWDEEMFLTSEMASTDYGNAKVMRHINTGILLDKYQEFFHSK